MEGDTGTSSVTFTITNSGTSAPTDPDLHPDDASAFLTSDVYRVSAAVEGDGWSARLLNAAGAEAEVKSLRSSTEEATAETESELEKGSRFSMTLPLVLPDDGPEGEAGSSTPRRATPCWSSSPATASSTIAAKGFWLPRTARRSTWG